MVSWLVKIIVKPWISGGHGFGVIFRLKTVDECVRAERNGPNLDGRNRNMRNITNRPGNMTAHAMNLNGFWMVGPEHIVKHRCLGSFCHRCIRRTEKLDPRRMIPEKVDVYSCSVGLVGRQIMTATMANCQN